MQLTLFYSNYADTNVCCNYAVFEVLLQLCWWYFLLHFILVDLFVAIMQLEVSEPFMQVKVFAANMWVTIFIEIMHVEVSVSIFYNALFT